MSAWGENTSDAGDARRRRMSDGGDGSNAGTASSLSATRKRKRRSGWGEVTEEEAAKQAQEGEKPSGFSAPSLAAILDPIPTQPTLTAGGGDTSTHTSRLHLLAQQLGMSPEQIKAARELYIGNLPPQLEVAQLVDFINAAVLALKGNILPGNPIVRGWKASEGGHFAFVEFRTMEEANNGLALNGVNCMGYGLRIGRPKTYPEALNLVPAAQKGTLPPAAGVSNGILTGIAYNTTVNKEVLGTAFSETNSRISVPLVNSMGIVTPPPDSMCVQDLPPPDLLSEERCRELLTTFGPLQYFLHIGLPSEEAIKARLTQFRLAASRLASFDNIGYSDPEPLQEALDEAAAQASMSAGVVPKKIIVAKSSVSSVTPPPVAEEFEKAATAAAEAERKAEEAATQKRKAALGGALAGIAVKAAEGAATSKSPDSDTSAGDRHGVESSQIASVESLQGSDVVKPEETQPSGGGDVKAAAAAKKEEVSSSSTTHGLSARGGSISAPPQKPPLSATDKAEEVKGEDGSKKDVDSLLLKKVKLADVFCEALLAEPAEKSICFTEFNNPLDSQAFLDSMERFRLAGNRVTVTNAEPRMADNVVIKMLVHYIIKRKCETAIAANPPRPTVPTRCLSFGNLATQEELTDDAEYAGVLDDVRGECRRTGRVISIEMPRPFGELCIGENGEGFVFVEFATVEEACKTRRALDGRRFCGRVVAVDFFSEERYLRREFSYPQPNYDKNHSTTYNPALAAHVPAMLRQMEELERAEREAARSAATAAANASFGGGIGTMAQGMGLPGMPPMAVLMDVAKPNLDEDIDRDEEAMEED